MASNGIDRFPVPIPSPALPSCFKAKSSNAQTTVLATAKMPMKTRMEILTLPEDNGFRNSQPNAYRKINSGNM